MGRRRIATGAVLAAVLLLSGCTPAPPPAPRPPAALRLATVTPAAPVWSVEVDLVGEPIVRNGVIASYVRTRKGLQVRAWQLADGLELWREDAWVGNTTRGEEVDLEPARFRGGDYVTFLAATPGFRPAELVVARLATGEHRKTRLAWVDATERPSDCGDAVCFERWSSPTKHLDDPAGPVRVDLTSGRYRRDAVNARPRDSEDLGGGLVVTGDAGEQRLALIERGRLVWTAGYERVFGPGASSDAGWSWTEGERDVVMTGGVPGAVKNGVFRNDLAHRTTVDLDARSGRVRWRMVGARPCHDRGLTSTASGGVLQLCRVSGVLTAPDRTHVPWSDVTLHAVRVERLGVDRRTGAIRWRHRGSQEDVLGDAPRPDADGRWAPVRQHGRVGLLDRRTGTVSPLPRGAGAACLSERPELRTRSSASSRVLDDWFAGTAVDACPGGGMTRFAVTSAGTSGGNGWWVVPGSERLSVFHFDR